VERKPASGKGTGLQLYSIAVNSVDEFEKGFKDAIKARIDALAVTGGALIGNNQKQVAMDVVDGGLMSYGPDESERYRRAALMVDKILKGARPVELPVEQPTKFELMINLKTAKALDLTIPPVVMMRAERVIK
jgi:ABC-type uncharacterized transport system substrate-binding protein